MLNFDRYRGYQELIDLDVRPQIADGFCLAVLALILSCVLYQVLRAPRCARLGVSSGRKADMVNLCAVQVEHVRAALRPMGEDLGLRIGPVRRRGIAPHRV